MSEICSKCGKPEIKSKGLCQKCYSRDYYEKNIDTIRIKKKERYIKNIIKCKEYQKIYSKQNSAKNTARAKKWTEDNPEKRQINLLRHNKKIGKLPMSVNKKCSLYLGCHVAERVLKHVFKNVEHYRYNNPGFDFVCGKGYKVDVKSSCLCYRPKNIPTWAFEIDKNKIADYFLLLAFDNREKLNPLHIWLIPGGDVNHQKTKSVNINTFVKWDGYALDIDRVSNCCDIMKGGHQ